MRPLQSNAPRSRSFHPFRVEYLLFCSSVPYFEICIWLVFDYIFLNMDLRNQKEDIQDESQQWKGTRWISLLMKSRESACCIFKKRYNECNLVVSNQIHSVPFHFFYFVINAVYIVRPFRFINMYYNNIRIHISKYGAEEPDGEHLRQDGTNRRENDGFDSKWSAQRRALVYSIYSTRNWNSSSPI